MGDTHYRSNLIEQTSGLKVEYSTGSFDTVKGNTLQVGDSFFRIGTDVYIVTGVPTAFDNAGISALATSAVGVTIANIGEGSMVLSASLNHAASVCFVKTAPATWCNVTTGAELG